MSRGTKVIPVRLAQELLDLIDREIEIRARHATVEPWTRSDFIRSAIREKVRHKRASRGERKNAPSKKKDS